MDGPRPGSTWLAVTGTVPGRVQGVSFPYAMILAAVGYDVAGWLRNPPNGRVALHAEGAIAAVETFLYRPRSGPPMACVDDLGYQSAPDSGAAGFEILR